MDRVFVEGMAAFIASIVLFAGSVYLLLAAIFGLRMGYLIAATGFFGFWVLLAMLWAFGARDPFLGIGTPPYLGPKGDLPTWVAVGSAVDVRSPNYPVINRYPGPPWQPPGPAETGEVEPVTLAFQEFLAEEAAAELRQRGVAGEITPEDFQVTNIRFTEVEETTLAAATAFSRTGGLEVEVVGLRDEGNEPLPSYLALGLGIIGLAIHLPFLDRAERRRKDVLTGGDQPPWRGPA
ncbi:MAG TPA: hypothetical protein VHL78_01345 [Actinomycetota bacterium]|nr:hypothetical protein [Actinomycetota bacterium]